MRDTTLNANGRLYLRLSEPWLLYTMLSGSRGVSLDPDHELVLGGENGLHPFRLVRIGGAVFFDMGRADMAFPLDGGPVRSPATPASG